MTHLQRIILATALSVLAIVALTRPSGPSVNAVPDRNPNEDRSWPMFGGSPSRNMVNLLEKNLPADWCVEEGKLKNVKWSADHGTRAMFGSPVVADGKVFVATNNGKSRDGNVIGEKAVLMAFRETDGKFLWQITHDYPANAIFNEVHNLGLLSTPAVDHRRLYYVTPACEVICADCADGKVLWRYDMMKELKVVPLHCNICAPLVHEDLVFVTTGNGTDEKGTLPAPNAPSFVALHKKTGKLAWESNLPGKRIIEGQWSNPTLALAKNSAQIVFGGGDGVIYSFEPTTGKLVWKCDCLPTRQKKDSTVGDNYIMGTPVVLGNRLFVGLGRHPENGRQSKSSHFLCLDTGKRGDVSLKSYDANDPANKDSALVWAFGGMKDPPPKKGRRVNFATTLSTAAVHDGLVYISEEAGYLHCLDAGTGQRFWEFDLQASVWGSPYFADGRVFLGTDDGEIRIFAHGRQAVELAKIDCEEEIKTTPIAANGVLYVTTRSKLYAIAGRK